METNGNNNDFKLILLPGAEKFGEKVNEHLKVILDSPCGFILPMAVPRFNDGEGKGKINDCDSARNAKVFIVQDVTNCFVNYNFRGAPRPYSPDDHYRDIIRAIGALRGHAKEISIVMPNLYEGRQHKGSAKESLDCSLALQELESYGIKRIVTFDIHNEGVANAIPKTELKNIHPTKPILWDFINNEDFDPNKTITISPDEGAIKRASYIRDVFDNQLAFFNKERDQGKIIDGKAKILGHAFIGTPSMVRGKDVIIRDDIIDSGGSMIDTIKQMKNLGAGRVFVIATFSLFSRGYEEFDKLYEEGYLYKVYSTNLTYVPEELAQRPWFHCTDCSRQLAEYLAYYKNEQSLNELNQTDPEMIRELALRRRKKRSH